MGSKVRNLTIGTSLCLAVLLIAATAGGQQESNTRAQGVTYNITDLGTLGTGANSVPNWVTESGEVVGYSENGQFDSNGNPIVHAFRWADGVMEDLGTLGGDYSQAYGANEDGQAAGIADVTGGAPHRTLLFGTEAR